MSEVDKDSRVAVTLFAARRPVSEGLYDIVFALNLASSFAYALRVCVIKRFAPAPPDDL